MSGGSPPRSPHHCSGRCKQGHLGRNWGEEQAGQCFPLENLTNHQKRGAGSLGKAALGGGAACVLQVVGCAAGHVMEITSDMYRKWDWTESFVLLWCKLLLCFLMCCVMSLDAFYIKPLVNSTSRLWSWPISVFPLHPCVSVGPEEAVCSPLFPKMLSS